MIRHISLEEHYLIFVWQLALHIIRSPQPWNETHSSSTLTKPFITFSVATSSSAVTFLHYNLVALTSEYVV